MSGPLLLAIESSCDETGIALVEGGRQIRSNVVASQVALHAATGGIVPEVAARAHLRWIVPVLDGAWADAGADWSDVDGVAVTYGPGLAGSLLVGVSFAKAIARVRNKPLIPVNHLDGHVEAAWLLDPGEEPRPEPEFPLVALVVSGGHTFLAEMRAHGDYRLLGETVDDAAGEAFDKVGRLLGLGYPGGPAIMRAAAGATDRNIVFPRAWLGDSYDFSFSGLKTAARRIVDAARQEAGLTADSVEGLPEKVVAELAWGFQDAVIDVLARKTARAAREIGARSIVVGGGVAANRVLAERMAAEAATLGLPLHVPRPGLCTDNGAMIGAAGGRRFLAGVRAGLDLDARPNLPLAVRANADPATTNPAKAGATDPGTTGQVASGPTPR
jgi:N6-L-threonylcarbamoyladenine synthase